MLAGINNYIAPVPKRVAITDITAVVTILITSIHLLGFIHKHLLSNCSKGKIIDTNREILTILI